MASRSFYYKAILMEAARHRKSVAISYANTHGEESQRTIEPLCVFTGRNGYTYIRAFCMLRNEERTFRLDRIQSVVLTNEDAVAAPRRPASSGLPAYMVPQNNTDLASTSGEPSWPETDSQSGDSSKIIPFCKKLLTVACVIGFLYLADIKPEIVPQIIESIVAGFFYEDKSDEFDYRGQIAYLEALRAEVLKKACEEPQAKPTSTQKLSAIDPWQKKIQSNAAGFRQATGIDSEALERLYASADTNRDSNLSWSEIQSFQNKLVRSYSYRFNTTALRPDEFIAQGGGDCEDWALLTCGLFRFWNIAAYVGCIRDHGTREGHAVCLVYQTREPIYRVHYHLDDSMTWSGRALPTGYYVPVDYENVGSLSSAVGKDWKLTTIYTPERIYGMSM